MGITAIVLAAITSFAVIWFIWRTEKKFDSQPISLLNWWEHPDRPKFSLVVGRHFGNFVAPIGTVPLFDNYVKNTVKNGVVIMSAQSWKGFKDGCPGRMCIVISDTEIHVGENQQCYSLMTVNCFSEAVTQAVRYCIERKVDDIFIVGSPILCQLAVELCEEVNLTEINGEIQREHIVNSGIFDDPMGTWVLKHHHAICSTLSWYSYQRSFA